MIYGYFLWNHKDPINGVDADEVEVQHHLSPNDSVYFITKNNNPFMIMKPNCELSEVMDTISMLDEETNKRLNMEELSNEVYKIKEDMNTRFGEVEDIIDEILVGE